MKQNRFDNILIDLNEVTLLIESAVVIKDGKMYDIGVMIRGDTPRKMQYNSETIFASYRIRFEGTRPKKTAPNGVFRVFSQNRNCDNCTKRFCENYQLADGTISNGKYGYLVKYPRPPCLMVGILIVSSNIRL